MNFHKYVETEGTPYVSEQNSFTGTDKAFLCYFSYTGGHLFHYVLLVAIMLIFNSFNAFQIYY